MNRRYTFNHNGMSEDELIFHSYCETKYANHTVIETERYGLGKYLRKYGFYPSFLPILLHADHGPNQWDFVTPHMLNSSASFFGFYSKRLVIDWLEQTKKKALLLKSPFVFYKESNDIKQLPNSQGSIFFHAHSTYWTDKETNFDLIFKQFDKLPKNFHPISICLHFVDVQKGRHKVYLDRGYAVYTAGSWKHPYFIENFYEIVKNFKYSLSNSVGSNLFYCINLGLPFSILEGEPTIIANTDPNTIKSGKSFIEHKQIQKNYILFKGLNNSITQEQLEFVNHELGLKEYASRFKVSLVLYSALLKHYSSRIIQKLNNVLKIKIKALH